MTLPATAGDTLASHDTTISRVSRYLQIATLLRSRIARNTWPVGTRIPNIAELAEEFSVARGTVRQALAVLEDERLLSCHRGRGNFVRGAPVGPRPHRLATDWSSLIAAHDGAEIQVLESAANAELPPDASSYGTLLTSYQMMRRLHSRDERPYLIGRFFLDSDLFQRGPSERFARQATLPILQELAGARIAAARQVVTVGIADVETAALLAVPMSSPIVLVTRHAVDQEGRLLYFGLGIYRGDMVRLEIELR